MNKALNLIKFHTLNRIKCAINSYLRPVWLNLFAPFLKNFEIFFHVTIKKVSFVARVFFAVSFELLELKNREINIK